MDRGLIKCLFVSSLINYCILSPLFVWWWDWECTDTPQPMEIFISLPYRCSTITAHRRRGLHAEQETCQDLSTLSGGVIPCVSVSRFFIDVAARCPETPASALRFETVYVFPQGCRFETKFCHPFHPFKTPRWPSASYLRRKNMLRIRHQWICGHHLLSSPSLPQLFRHGYLQWMTRPQIILPRASCITPCLYRATPTLPRSVVLQAPMDLPSSTSFLLRSNPQLCETLTKLMRFVQYNRYWLRRCFIVPPAFIMHHHTRTKSGRWAVIRALARPEY